MTSITTEWWQDTALYSTGHRATADEIVERQHAAHHDRGQSILTELMHPEYGDATAPR